MSQFSKSTSRYWTILLCIGVFSFFVTLFPPISRPLLVYRQNIITGLDWQMASFSSYAQTFQMKLRNDMDLPSKLSSLEQYNRKLAAQLSESTQKIQVLEQVCVATPSARLQTSIAASSFLSKVDGKWIILSGLNEGIEAGQIVLLDTVYLGSVETVMPTFSTITTLGETQKPILVLHENSRELGLFTLEKGKQIVQFSSRIETVHINDQIISVPDGKNSSQSYPVGVVSALSTTAADSVSVVEIKLQAEPKVGESVDIVQVSK